MDFCVRPEHYVGGTLAFIQNVVKDMTPEQAIMVFNVIKYVSRFHKKNGIEDLKKAHTYLYDYIAAHSLLDIEDEQQ